MRARVLSSSDRLEPGGNSYNEEGALCLCAIILHPSSHIVLFISLAPKAGTTPSPHIALSSQRLPGRKFSAPPSSKSTRYSFRTPAPVPCLDSYFKIQLPRNLWLPSSPLDSEGRQVGCGVVYKNCWFILTQKRSKNPCFYIGLCWLPANSVQQQHAVRPAGNISTRPGTRFLDPKSCWETLGNTINEPLGISVASKGAHLRSAGAAHLRSTQPSSAQGPSRTRLSVNPFDL